MYEDKENTKFLLVLFTSIIYVFIAIFIIFLIGLTKVEAASWTQFNEPNDIYICGSNSDYLECTYTYENNGVIKNKIIDNYMVIIEDIQLNANKLYEIELTWNLATYALNNNESSYITISNYKNFTASITAKYGTANGEDLPTENRTWQLMNSQLINRTDGVYALYEYKYKNIIEPTTSYQRLFFKITKRNQWYSIGTSDAALYKSIIISQLNYKIIEIGDNGAANIIASNNKNTEDIINNQNQNTQQIIDSVTNPDISDSNNTIGGFFDSFSDTDHGGLSGIITAPLVAFNQMLTGTCTDLSVEYKGSTTTLPCGTSFWNQISPIRDFLNITLGGLICYQIIRKLFLLIQKIKNPDDDRVEVMSL